MFLQSSLFLFIVTSDVICGFKINKREYMDHKRSGFLGNQFSGSNRNGGGGSSAGVGFPASNEGPFSSSGNLVNSNSEGEFSGSRGVPFNSNGNGGGGFPGSNSGNGGIQGGRGPFNGNGGSGGIGGGSGPFNSNGNTGGGFPSSNSGNGGIQGGGAFGSGSGPFNSNGNGGGFPGSNPGNGVIQGGGGPFNANGNGGSGNIGSGSGPFSTGNGNSNNGGSMSSGGGASPFSNAANGGGNGMGPGPFSAAGNGGGSGPFNSNGGKMASPFSAAAKAGSGETPFKISNSALGGKSPFGTSTFQGVDFGSMGGALATNNAVRNPMDASSFVENSVGPGGLTGSAFATNINADGGPGGLTGGSFHVGTDSSGPGGLTGGGFPQTDNSNGALYINTDSSLGDRQSARFDTAKYEQMLSQLYNPNNYDSHLLEKPFNGKEYSSNSNSFGSYSSSGVNYMSGQAGHSSAGSISGGKQTDEPGPFDTRPFKQVQSPFSAHTETQYKGTNYHVDAASSLGGQNFAAVGYSGGTYNIDSSATSPYNAGNAASYVRGNGDGSATGYETPFDKHVDNYNELISNPFNSNMKPDPGSDYSHGSFGTPFESHSNSGGMGSENPGGNPFRQGGNKAGISMTYNNRPFSG
ncbi:uncharacterized protein LOC133192970 [Saccostrea echinata]|uniref:uncharacterized protein LOC133192970 n=1 Tax=Saccostrea echinata TaxID=191078 RepID=UPI002A81EE25|nr:uncharacterized protein LOC133192970 [Saccostrea echinata]